MKWVSYAGFWKSRGLPEPVSEFKFHPKRKWRFDFAWPDAKAALEVNGGVWIRGRHTRGAGQIGDMLKLNEAQRLKWRVFQFTPQQMESEETAEFLREVLFSERNRNA